MRTENEMRIREIQSRARLLGIPEESPPEKKGPSAFRNPPPAKKAFPAGIEEDKLLVLAILWLLWNEHADSRLLLALLYLLF